MATHRIRRWFQFGVLDLLIVTTIVAVVAGLWRLPRLYELLAEGATAGDRWSDNGLRMRFCWCPPGEFQMGESPNQVEVKLTHGFWIGKYEVTQAEYRQVIGDNPSCFPIEVTGRDWEALPVERVTWHEAVEFCRTLTERERAAGRLPAAWEYRLPTEAQWEYACRAGTHTTYSFGDAEQQLVDFAWCDANSERRTHAVGQKPPNPWGLHDMHGNVWEWCQDWHQETLTGGLDPVVAKGDWYRVNRGGSWFKSGMYCQSAVRNAYAPILRYYDLGFRVAIVQTL